jgi:hypothetical protein
MLLHEVLDEGETQQELLIKTSSGSPRGIKGRPSVIHEKGEKGTDLFFIFDLKEIYPFLSVKKIHTLAKLDNLYSGRQ